MVACCSQRLSNEECRRQCPARCFCSYREPYLRLDAGADSLFFDGSICERPLFSCCACAMDQISAARDCVTIPEHSLLNRVPDSRSSRDGEILNESGQRMPFWLLETVDLSAHIGSSAPRSGRRAMSACHAGRTNVGHPLQAQSQAPASARYQQGIDLPSGVLSDTLPRVPDGALYHKSARSASSDEYNELEPYHEMPGGSFGTGWHQDIRPSNVLSWSAEEDLSRLSDWTQSMATSSLQQHGHGQTSPDVRLSASAPASTRWDPNEQEVIHIARKTHSIPLAYTVRDSTSAFLERQNRKPGRQRGSKLPEEKRRKVALMRIVGACEYCKAGRRGVSDF